MSRYFGTDGIRGKAEMFTGEFLERIVRGLDVGNKRVLIGGDTRESTKHILENLELSLINNGAREIGNIGVFPTPGLNYVMYSLVYDYAIDVTASHNPYTDNGIKIFKYTDDGGIKLDEEERERIEQLLEDDAPLNLFEPHEETMVYDEKERALQYYAKHLMAGFGEKADLAGLKLALDCANGATGIISERAFRKLRADITIINNDVTFGRKINDGVGSTHIEGLQALVRNGDFDFGAAFDGDGDRCILVDESGAIVDGDQILAIIAKHFGLARLVTTVMANQGLLNWGASNGVEISMTDVGDQNVSQEMRAHDIKLGGEQSGHIILPGEAMGDGVLTALTVARIMKETGKTLSELAREMKKLPQVLVNLPVTDEEKAKLAGSEAAQEVTARYSEKLEKVRGRVLVRPSGTENLIRITMWGEEQDVINMLADELADELKEALRNGND